MSTAPRQGGRELAGDLNLAARRSSEEMSRTTFIGNIPSHGARDLLPARR